MFSTVLKLGYKKVKNWMLSRLVKTLILIILPIVCAAQGSVLLIGGGSENYNDWSDVPYRWMVDHALNKKILVMHYSSGSTWLEGYFKSLGAVSATSFVVASTTAANDSAAYKTILAADGIFLRGGDQYQYISKWKGTLTEKAIREVYHRGGVIAGSSAGEAVLSQVIFDARVASTDPRNALRNPLSSGITFTEDFLGFVSGILADTHFYERGRLGRLLAMIAVYKSQTGKEITGVGVDYNTALAISSDGVGEVMGSGTVTILRFSPATQYVLEPGKPLSMSNVRLDQLTKGFKFNTLTGEILVPATAVSFQPKSVDISAESILLDGSGRIADWFSVYGSLKRLTTQLSNSTDTIGIVSSPASNAIVSSVDSCLKQWNISSRLLWINEATKNDQVLSTSIAHCAAFIFVGNNGDSLARFLNGSTIAGSALFTQFSNGKPALFLGNDGILAADSGVGQLEKNIYGAYYGYLTLVKGISALQGISIVPRLYEISDYIDNRASGLFWGMGKSHNAFGILLDAGSYVSVTNKNMQVFGPTPAMIIDARAVRIVDFPTWKDPGKANPRQNVALIGAMIHVLRETEVFDLSYLSEVRIDKMKNDIPTEFSLSQNYPNPFNPTTNIFFSLVQRGLVSLKIFDILGKEITTIVNEEKSAGSYSLKFNGSFLPSGVYLYRLQTERNINTKRMVLLK